MRRFSDGAEKDTLRNVRATGEFVVNVVTEDVVEAANETAREYPRRARASSSPPG